MPGHQFFMAKKAARKLVPDRGMTEPEIGLTPLGAGQRSAPLTIGQFSPVGGGRELGVRVRGSTEEITLLEQAVAPAGVSAVPDLTNPLSEAYRRRRRAQRLGG